MINNGLTSYFALWTDKETDIGFFSTNSPNKMYNNIIETDFGTAFTGASVNIVLIIKNVPYTKINNIQALVLYNKTVASFSLRTVVLAIELYNSINDPDLTEALATTNVITSDEDTYRFDFPSLSTYTGSFASGDSTTLIINNSVALAEDAIFTDYDFDITGDVVVEGDLTANNLIVGSTNLITEINTKQDLITTATDLDCNSLTTTNLEVNGGVNIDTSKYFDAIVIR
jgi:hypothetical protein